MTIKSPGLTERIERSNMPMEAAQPEDFVRPLVDEIQKEIVVPAVNLLSPETARSAQQTIADTALKIERYRNQLARLRPLIEQRKFQLDSGDTDA